MKLPRDISGDQLVKKLERLGYRSTRQTGSHIRLTCDLPSQHHVTVPRHNPFRLGTLSGILGDFAEYQKISREELLRIIFE